MNFSRRLYSHSQARIRGTLGIDQVHDRVRHSLRLPVRCGINSAAVHIGQAMDLLCLCINQAFQAFGVFHFPGGINQQHTVFGKCGINQGREDQIIIECCFTVYLQVTPDMRIAVNGHRIPNG
ncbi:hypothetical protein D3C86_1547030 [compost metagenome]